MNTIKSLGLVGVAAAALFAAQAFAAPCPTAPATGNPTQGSHTCIAPQGLDGPGTGLQDLLNGITKSGTPQIDVYNGQYTPSSAWTFNSSTGSVNNLLFEIAGHADINSFGVFDLNSTFNKNGVPSNFLQIFGGPADPGAMKTLQYGKGGVFGSYTIGGNTKIFGSGMEFGYYLHTKKTDDNPSYWFFSIPSLNGDGTNHMVAFQGNDVTKLDESGSGSYFTFSPNEFLLAWEDLPSDISDLDYNDFVVSVESVHPVPEPTALGMFGLGVLLIGGFVGLRRRQAFTA